MHERLNELRINTHNLACHTAALLEHARQLGDERTSFHLTMALECLVITKHHLAKAANDNPPFEVAT